MFQPFNKASEFYPGLILWCDPSCYEMDISTLAPGESYDRRKTRELRPCLVVSVNEAGKCFQVARFCATKVSGRVPKFSPLTEPSYSPQTQSGGSGSTARPQLPGGSTTPGYGSARRRLLPWYSTTRRSCIVRKWRLTL